MPVMITDASGIDKFKGVIDDSYFELHDKLRDEYLDNFMFDMPSIYDGFHYKVSEKDIIVTAYEPDKVENGKLTIPLVFDGIAQGEDGLQIGNEVQEIDLGRVLHLGIGVLNATPIRKITGKYLQILGQRALEHCPQLSEVDMPALVAADDLAFSHCTNLAKIVLPSLRNIGNEVFSDCSYLESCDIHGVRMAGGNTGRQEAPFGIFKGCKRLVNLDISGALCLGKGALYGCISLKELNLRLCRSFEEQSLAYCESLETLYLDNVMGFKEKALEGCVSLSTVNYYGDYNKWSDVMIESEVELNVLKNVTVNANYKDPE